MFKFYFENKAREVFHAGWGHGLFADFWSFVHLFTGIGAGLFISIADFPPLYSLIAVIVLMIIYEGIEMFAGIIEDKENSLVDIILGTLGTASILFLQNLFEFSRQELGVAFIVIVLINVTLTYKGWLGYMRRRGR